VNKSKLYGLIGSTVSTTVLLLVLWFVVLSVPGSTENEGFLVSFGDSYDAGGVGVSGNSSTQTNTVPVENKTQVKQAIVTTKIASQAVFTQKENSVSISEQKEKERVRKEQELNQIQQNETKKRIAEQKQKEQDAISKANSINGLFGNSGSGTGSGKGGSGGGTGKGVGSGSGVGIQGNPSGKGTNGVGFTLNLGNRKYYGDPAKPNYPKDVEGKITVNIRVDINGIVTNASIGTPTTISDTEMRKDAISAANKTRFTVGKNIETGSITYNYRLE